MGDGALALDKADARPPLLRLFSDARLAKLAAAGSASAFAAIYRRHHQEIYRYCRSLLGDDHDARDALQNTMVKAMAALEGETREIKLRPWLFRIAHNEAISLLRRRPPEVAIEAAAEMSSPEADLESRQRLRTLLDDLDQLTDHQRGALVMRELSGLEFSEIAAALDTSPEGAKQALYEARVALRDLERGREMSCDDVCRQISENDRRRLRARGIRAHLKACESCRTFAEQIRERRGQLAALAPPLPATAALAVLKGIIGGGGGGLAIATGGAASVGGITALKLGVAAVAAVGLGSAAIDVSGTAVTADARPDRAAVASGAGSGAKGAAAAEAGSKGSGSAQGGGDRANGRKADAGTPEPSPASPGGSPAAPTPGGPPATAGNGSAASDAAPGHGGTPPGQGGTPPGLGGSAAPGQGGTPPGLGGNRPPGQGGTPPGQSGVAGASGSAPGHGATPPGKGGTPPGKSATAPVAP